MSTFPAITANAQELEARIASTIFYDKMEEDFNINNKIIKQDKRNRIYTSFFKLLQKHKVRFVTNRDVAKDGVILRFPRNYWDGEQVILCGFTQINPIKLYMVLGAYFNSLHYSFYDREQINFGSKDGVFTEFDVILGMMIAKAEGIEYTEDLFEFYQMKPTDDNILKISEYVEPRINSLMQIGLLTEDFEPTYSTYNKFLGKEMIVETAPVKTMSAVDNKKSGSYTSSTATQKALGLYKPSYKNETSAIIIPDPIQKFVDFLLEA